MRRCLAIFALFLSAAFSVNAQSSEINGISTRKKPLTVKLFKVVSGQIVQIASTNPTANGVFNFKFQPAYKGYYVIGFGDAKEVKDKFKLYVKGNDKINLLLNDSTYVLTGVNTKENQVLASWQKLAFGI